MRAVIEVASGLHTGHKILLADGQCLEVGRCCMADLAIENDESMSPYHFKLSSHEGTCYLEDLTSTHGTFVNGQSVRRASLTHDDRIMAGATSFRLSIEESNGTFSAPRAVEPRGPCRAACFAYAANRSRSGLHGYRGRRDILPPATLAQHLGREFCQTVVVNVPRLPDNLHQHFADAEYLLDWLPEDACRATSPVLLTRDQQVRRWPVFDEAWGRDALVVLYSKLGKPPPLANIRRASGLFARPSLARRQLETATDEVACSLLGGIEAVLVEDDPADYWQLLSSPDLTHVFEPFVAGPTEPGLER